MDLLWVRHGEPERIAAGTGVPADPALTARGREQAERLAEWLASESIDVILSSPQRRARRDRRTDRARTRSRGAGHERTDGVRLAIRLLHPHGGTPGDERSAPDSDVRRALGGVRRRTRRICSVPRVAASIDEIVAAHPGRRVVAVCHGGVINVAFAIALGLDRHLWFEPHYTSLSRMVASRTGVRSVASINERATSRRAKGTGMSVRREPA